MKTMTCSQLGGACDKSFHAETFEEMAQQSQQHAQEMFQVKDAPHLEAMNRMQSLMQDPTTMTKWMEQKKTEFDQLPDSHIL